MKPPPSSRLAKASAAFLVASLALHVFHVYLEATGRWPSVEGVVSTTTLLTLASAMTFWGVWMVGNMISGRVLNVAEVAQAAYRLGWHDRDVLEQQHRPAPDARPDLHLLTFEDDNTGTGEPA